MFTPGRVATSPIRMRGWGYFGGSAAVHVDQAGFQAGDHTPITIARMNASTAAERPCGARPFVKRRSKSGVIDWITP